jgi:hypothetical protein
LDESKASKQERFLEWLVDKLSNSSKKKQDIFDACDVGWKHSEEWKKSVKGKTGRHDPETKAGTNCEDAEESSTNLLWI